MYLYTIRRRSGWSSPDGASVFKRLGALGAGLVAAGALAPVAAAADFTVTRTDDPAPNGCARGDCSLREAVIAASQAGGTNEIRVSPGATYTLQRPATRVARTAISTSSDRPRSGSPAPARRR